MTRLVKTGYYVTVESKKFGPFSSIFELFAFLKKEYGIEDVNTDKKFFIEKVDKAT